MSFFLKPSAEIALYCIHIYSKLILPALKELKEEHSAKIRSQSVTVLENLLDYMKTDKFCLYYEQFKVYFFNYGPVLVDLFEGSETEEITFKLKIVAKKKVEQEVTCRKNKMV